MARWTPLAIAAAAALAAALSTRPRFDRPTTGVVPIHHPAHRWTLHESRPLLRYGTLDGARLTDPWQVADELALSPEEVSLLPYFDGRRTLQGIVADVVRDMPEDAAFEFRKHAERLHRRLDEGLWLVNARFLDGLRRQMREFDRSSVRPPLNRFTGVLELQGEPLQGVRGLIAPHIDYARGSAVYARAYASVRGRPFRRVVILGTSHRPAAHYFTLTRKNFGSFEVDREFVDRLEKAYPHPARVDEFLHRSEHSIELQLPWIELALGKIPIVPILCGPLRDRHAEIDDFVRALRSLVDDRTLVVAASDLAHLGPGFASGEDLTPELLAQVEREDRESLASLDAPTCYARFAERREPRRICGGMPIYLLYRVLDPASPALLAYRQCSDGFRCVTIAGVALR